MSTPTSNPPPSNGEKANNTIAIISYITLIGWVIALVMHNGNKTKLGAFHLRQTLGLMIVGIVLSIVITIVGIILAFVPVVGWIIALVLNLAFGLGMLYLWIMGLLAAIKGEEKPMPWIGEMIQQKLGGVFA